MSRGSTSFGRLGSPDGYTRSKLIQSTLYSLAGHGLWRPDIDPIDPGLGLDELAHLLHARSRDARPSTRSLKARGCIGALRANAAGFNLEFGLPEWLEGYGRTSSRLHLVRVLFAWQSGVRRRFHRERDNDSLRASSSRAGDLRPTPVIRGSSTAAVRNH